MRLGRAKVSAEALQRSAELQRKLLAKPFNARGSKGSKHGVAMVSRF